MVRLNYPQNSKGISIHSRKCKTKEFKRNHPSRTVEKSYEIASVAASEEVNRIQIKARRA
jgi:(p)ppGpp synthase/HD superfamily hydrolase